MRQTCKKKRKNLFDRQKKKIGHVINTKETIKYRCENQPHILLSPLVQNSYSTLIIR